MIFIIQSFSFYFSNDIPSFKSSHDFLANSQIQCSHAGDNIPEIYALKTISGVHYDGGHWFHVAENFMVQHSILKLSQREGKASEIYFLTDRG